MGEYKPARAPGEGAAVAALLLGATLWGVLWYPLRLLEARGVAGLWSTLLIYAAALAILAAPAVRALRRGAGGRWGLLMALAAGWTNVAFVLAVLEGTVMRVLLLFYLSPVWAVVLARLLLGEPVTRGALAVLALAMAGAGAMLWSPELGMPWPAGRADWLALTSGMAFAVTNVAVRRLQAMPLAAKTALSWVGVLAVAAAMLAVEGAPAPADPVGIAGALAVGALLMTVMTLSVQYGVTRLPVGRSAVILLFELVAGAVSSYLLAGEALRPAEWAGGGLIVAAAVAAARRGG
ncbi:DMT family transporter [Inmirania thermothiophila]|uniref:EamA domain-containing membrane protein RarD n=1 Tax=Inmirania thermothiophila TaxID=1750597 RepID=A0A3N1Y0Z9_9GAMM|nr:DMT family transporter [Inmirania thermothiophila]ROR32211.1 EamA domain-containing membrane protein RarD [Inmirania thermothiophila]